MRLWAMARILVSPAVMVDVSTLELADAGGSAETTTVDNSRQAGGMLNRPRITDTPLEALAIDVGGRGGLRYGVVKKPKGPIAVKS